MKTSKPNANLPDDSFNRAFIYRICFVAAMGGLLFGYDWVVIGGAKPFYEPFFGITDSPWWQGWGMSSALLGCLVGAVVSGGLADRLGRKKLLIVAGVLFTLSAIGTGLAWDFFSFNVFRIIGGIGIGLASNLSPMYIAEISPPETRGRMVSINQLTIVVGILAAQIMNLWIAQPMSANPTIEMIASHWNGTVGWRWMFAAETIPAGLFLLMMFFIPESPRWLLGSGGNRDSGSKRESARKILAAVGGDAYADEEVANIEASIERSAVEEASQPDSRSQRSGLTNILLLGVFLAVFQQWCGINVIFNYAQEIFTAAGYGVGDIMLNIVITGLVNLVFTFVAMVTVDWFGRRGLMLFGAGGLAMIYGVLGACFYYESTGIHMLILVVSAIACYAMSLAPVTWVVISEIFPNRVRGPFVAISVFALWSACAILTVTFPYLNKTLGSHGTFWLYGAVCVIGFVVIWWKLPETKQRSLEEIEASLR